jgi:hypothetical protein
MRSVNDPSPCSLLREVGTHSKTEEQGAKESADKPFNSLLWAKLD